jgi:hypothetical protein
MTIVKKISKDDIVNTTVKKGHKYTVGMVNHLALNKYIVQ